MESGGQPGNHNAVKGKRWANAIDTALDDRCKSDGQKALVKLAEVMLLAAEKSEGWALKELGDRLDGKPAQSIGIHGEEDKPPVTIIERLIVHATDKDSEGI